MHSILRMTGKVSHLDPHSILFYHATSRKPEGAERGASPEAGSRRSGIHEGKGEFYSMVPKFFEPFLTDMCCLCLQPLNRGGFGLLKYTRSDAYRVKS